MRPRLRRTVLVSLLAIVVYAGAYAALVEVRPFSILVSYPNSVGTSNESELAVDGEAEEDVEIEENENTGTSSYRALVKPHYRIGGEFSRLLFIPAYAVDRLIRPSHWTFALSPPFPSSAVDSLQ